MHKVLRMHPVANIIVIICIIICIAILVIYFVKFMRSQSKNQIIKMDDNQNANIEEIEEIV